MYNKTVLYAWFITIMFIYDRNIFKLVELIIQKNKNSKLINITEVDLNNN